jgi:hypothetical protein
LRADRARRYPIDFRRKCREIDVRLDLGQRISKRVDLLPMMFVSEQVRLDGSALLHGWCQRTKSGQRNFTNRRGPRFFEVPFIHQAYQQALNDPAGVLQP